jgi:hypothetical protein
MGTVTMPTISVSGSTITATGGNYANWPTLTQIAVCKNPIVSEVTSPQARSFLNAGICVFLFTTAVSDNDPANRIPATDLSNAYADTGQNRPRYNPVTHGVNFLALTFAFSSGNPYAVATATVQASASSPESVSTPYTGPIVQAPGAVRPVASGTKMVLEGSNLSGVSKATIGGKDASVKVNSSSELELTVPAGLEAGTYDLVISSDSGLLTVQDAIVISGSAIATETIQSTARPSTKLKEDNTVKVHVFNVVGAGKVQIMLNGEEVAWINTNDPDDSKLLNEYLVRTLELADGKNVIEIWVNGVRIDRKAYTKKIDDDMSSIN